MYLFLELNRFYNQEIIINSNMEIKETGTEMVTVTKSGLLSLVADKLKDRVLFSEKVEEAKHFINNIISCEL